MLHKNSNVINKTLALQALSSINGEKTEYEYAEGEGEGDGNDGDVVCVLLSYSIFCCYTDV